MSILIYILCICIHIKIPLQSFQGTHRRKFYYYLCKEKVPYCLCKVRSYSWKLSNLWRLVQGLFSFCLSIYLCCCNIENIFSFCHDCCSPKVARQLLELSLNKLTVGARTTKLTVGAALVSTEFHKIKTYPMYVKQKLNIVFLL